MYVKKYIYIANITVNNEIIANPVFFCFAVTQQQHQRKGGVITLNNGKELQLELHKKHEKRKCGCPRHPMLDDDLLTPTEETKEKENRKAKS